MQTNCRIGKVTPKGNIRLLERPNIGISAEDRQKMRENLETCMGHYPDNLAFVVVAAMGMDGYYTSACRVHPSSMIGKKMLPLAVAEILRLEAVDSIVVGRLNGD